uniref:Uncharacterized protein n=1 Tax=Paramormyrops kingsleyae TaxID=1676925 RepID=A0A3B3SGX3_9TELE
MGIPATTAGGCCEAGVPLPPHRLPDPESQLSPVRRRQSESPRHTEILLGYKLRRALTGL